MSHWIHGREVETSLIITTMLEASADSLTIGYTALFCRMEIPVDGFAGLGWIHCTGTLPEQILSLSTTPASTSIISRIDFHI